MADTAENNFELHLRTDLTAAQHYRIQSALHRIAMEGAAIYPLLCDAYGGAAPLVTHFIGEEGTLFAAVRRDLAANPPKISPQSGMPHGNQ